MNTGDVLKRLRGHSKYVRCVKFVGGSKKIVSGSKEGTVAVWEWEKSEARSLVLEGHNGSVNGVAASGDGERIVSGSDDGTLTVWNGKTGFEDAKFEQGSAVYCAAMCTDDQKVAIGLENGT